MKPHSARDWAEALVDEFVRQGVSLVCMAPGSRSTPLVAAAAAHPGLNVVVHPDERGNAFFCIGYGRATGRPAIWLTTSGTAVANGLPAAVEATMDHVPIILLTADRPPELRGSGANQTISQPNIFGEYTRLAVDLPTPDGSTDADTGRMVVRKVMAASMTHPRGPVHLNAPFRKPLQPEADEQLPPTHSSPGFAAVPHLTSDFGMAPDDAVLQALAAQLDGLGRVVVLAGRLDRHGAEASTILASRLKAPLLPDVCSQLRLGCEAPETVPYADLLAASGAVPRPDAVIQVGRMPVSQRLTRYLADSASVWAVLADGDDRIDPYGVVTHRLRDAVTSARALAGLVSPASDTAFVDAWLQANARVARGLDERFERQASSDRLTEPLVARLATQRLPEGHGLVLASSMPVRDVNSFASAAAVAPPVVVSNRGASGIDGTIATAAGATEGLGRPVTLLLGDLAGLHDLNSLALLRGRPVTVILINNDGGGIFSFLPIAQHDNVFESYFGTPHGLSFEPAAAMFGLRYSRPATPTAFVKAYDRAVRSGEPSLIEVLTQRQENVRVHEDLAGAVSNWLKTS